MKLHSSSGSLTADKFQGQVGHNFLTFIGKMLFFILYTINQQKRNNLFLQGWSSIGDVGAAMPTPAQPPNAQLSVICIRKIAKSQNCKIATVAIVCSLLVLDKNLINPAILPKHYSVQLRMNRMKEMWNGSLEAAIYNTCDLQCAIYRQNYS